MILPRENRRIPRKTWHSAFSSTTNVSRSGPIQNPHHRGEMRDNNRLSHSMVQL